MKARHVAAWVAVLALTGGCAQTGQGQPAPVVTPTAAAVAPLSPVPRSAPVSIDVPAIKAHSTLIPLGLKPDGSLDVPDVHHPQQASYYCVTSPNPTQVCTSGVLPGQLGPAVIVGHVDGAKQQGVFYRLKDMKIGDTATVIETNGTALTFSAYRILKVAKTQFPSSVVYGDTVGSELRLITCTGSFIGGQMGYADNEIVFMALVPSPPT